MLVLKFCFIVYSFCTDMEEFDNSRDLLRMAEMLYGLVHARYIISSQGLLAMVSY
jgi:hypothetical protein